MIEVTVGNRRGLYGTYKGGWLGNTPADYDIIVAMFFRVQPTTYRRGWTVCTTKHDTYVLWKHVRTRTEAYKGFSEFASGGKIEFLPTGDNRKSDLELMHLGRYLVSPEGDVYIFELMDQYPSNIRYTQLRQVKTIIQVHNSYNHTQKAAEEFVKRKFAIDWRVIKSGNSNWAWNHTVEITGVPTVQVEAAVAELSLLPSNIRRFTGEVRTVTIVDPEMYDIFLGILDRAFVRYIETLFRRGYDFRGIEQDRLPTVGVQLPTGYVLLQSYPGSPKNRPWHLIARIREEMICPKHLQWAVSKHGIANHDGQQYGLSSIRVVYI